MLYPNNVSVEMDDCIIPEPSAMFVYFETKRPSPSFYPPLTPRKEVTHWMDYVTHYFMPPFMEILTSSEMYMKHDFRTPLRDAYKRLCEGWRGPFFFGAHYSIVDMMLAPLAARRPLMRQLHDFDPVPASPDFVKYLDALVVKEKEVLSEAFLKAMLADMQYDSSDLTSKVPVPQTSSNGGSLKDDAPIAKELGPLACVQLEARAINGILSKMDSYAQNTQTLSELMPLFATLFALVHQHSDFKNKILLPELAGQEDVSLLQDNMPGDVEGLVDIPRQIALTQALPSGDNMSGLHSLLQRVSASLESSLLSEDRDLIPVLARVPADARDRIFKLYFDAHRSFFHNSMPALLLVLSPALRAQYVDIFADVLARHEFERVCEAIKGGVPQEIWTDIAKRGHWDKSKH
eukprot:TRINITY_DN6234_c0_g1_i3.p1 TRINITY_DN6234_c0_g1~~TRINITY_DN6234_c0_g1_i3.p1  ORF type:complete len:405 (+),score=72.92 TRINITY_DN6234_c0_g1_i3:234-1448(+)